MVSAVRTNGLVCLDLSRPEELDLLRRYGPFITNARVWAHGDPLPVNETADSFHDLPRYTYRLDPAELERMRAALAKVGPPSSTLVPGGSGPASASDTSLHVRHTWVIRGCTCTDPRLTAGARPPTGSAPPYRRNPE